MEVGAVEEPLVTIERLVESTNRHDLDALVGCFAEDYRNETPAHPARSFTGKAQVGRNWSEIFAFVPDIQVQVLRAAVDGDAVWTEWAMEGTRRDGTPSRMRGVIVFGVSTGLIRWARFYLEPVDESSTTVDEARRGQVVR